MRAINRTLGALTMLTLCGVTTANASILTVSPPPGSEALLSIVDGTGASMSVDLGEQIADIAIGDTYSLTTAVTNFITAAGGLASVKFAVIAGSATNGTSAGQYLQSSDNNTLTNIANAVRGTWFSKIGDLISKLNTIDGSAGNLTYGPIAAGLAGNYQTGPGSNGYDDWGSAGTCAANDNVCNLVAGNQNAFLYLVNFAGSASGFATIDGIGGIVPAAGTAAVAYLDTANSQLVIGSSVSAVPVPAAVWFFGSAMGLLGFARRRLA